MADALCVSKYSISSAVSRDTCLPALSGRLTVSNAPTRTRTHTHTLNWSRASTERLSASTQPDSPSGSAGQKKLFLTVGLKSRLIHFHSFSPSGDVRVWTRLIYETKLLGGLAAFALCFFFSRSLLIAPPWGCSLRTGVGGGGGEEGLQAGWC